MKYITFVLILLTGCTSLTRDDIDPEGILFASFYVVEDAHFGLLKKKHGYAFYIEEGLLNNSSLPILHGYIFRSGKIVEHFQCDRDVAKKIQDIDIQPFVYENETKLAAQRIIEVEPNTIPFPMVRDGAKWSIYIKSSSGEFRWTEWNPGADFELYAPYSKSFESLHTLLTTIARCYGSYHIHL